MAIVCQVAGGLPLLLAFFLAGNAWSQETGSLGFKDRMTLLKTEPANNIVAASARQAILNLHGGTTNASVPVVVAARRHEFIEAYRGNFNSTLSLVEVEVRSEGQHPFAWHCWDWASYYPHDFRIYTAIGKSYACYASSLGVKLFRIETAVDSEKARTFLLEHKKNPDEITPLTTEVLQQNVGEGAFLGVNELYWTIVVDEVADTGGELHVILHGVQPGQRFIFALKGNEWRLVGTREE